MANLRRVAKDSPLTSHLAVLGSILVSVKFSFEVVKIFGMHSWSGQERLEKGD